MTRFTIYTITTDKLTLSISNSGISAATMLTASGALDLAEKLMLAVERMKEGANLTQKIESN